jgi:hypothetical protein
VAHACNPSYSGGRDEEDHSSKPAWLKIYNGEIAASSTKVVGKNG